MTAAVDLQKVEGGFAIKTIALDLEARVRASTQAKFQAIAEGAKKGCPVSKALAATPIRSRRSSCSLERCTFDSSRPGGSRALARRRHRGSGGLWLGGRKGPRGPRL